MRLGRYLKGTARCVQIYEWQEEGAALVGYSNSGWAGCRTTGKSTSGGLIQLGTHLLETWSRTQDSVALSSAEAELVALSKLAAEVLGVGSEGHRSGMSIPAVCGCLCDAQHCKAPRCWEDEAHKCANPVAAGEGFSRDPKVSKDTWRGQPSRRAHKPRQAITYLHNNTLAQQIRDSAQTEPVLV